MATTRKPARPRATDTPAKVSMNLDTLERENGVEEPFVIALGGKLLTFTDPQEIPWQDLMGLDDPEEFARLTLPEDQRETFLKTKIPTWKMQRLMRGFRDHYGIGELGNGEG